MGEGERGRKKQTDLGRKRQTVNEGEKDRQTGGGIDRGEKKKEVMGRDESHLNLNSMIRTKKGA